MAPSWITLRMKTCKTTSTSKWDFTESKLYKAFRSYKSKPLQLQSSSKCSINSNSNRIHISSSNRFNSKIRDIPMVDSPIKVKMLLLKTLLRCRISWINSRQILTSESTPKSLNELPLSYKTSKSLLTHNNLPSLMDSTRIWNRLRTATTTPTIIMGLLTTIFKIKCLRQIQITPIRMGAIANH